MPVKSIAGIDMIVGQTQEDIERVRRDGFIAIRDDAGKLLMRYHPTKNLIEIQRRGIKMIIDLDQYKKQAEDDKVVAAMQGEYNFWKMMTDHHSQNNESATSAASEGGANGRCTH